VIIPFTWKHQIIGYTARALVDGIKPKYHNSHEPNFVFNVDKQLPTSQFVIVVEGPFDAMSVDGVAILSNEINDTQADIIESLGREVIIVPDFDVHINERTGKKAWPGRSLIDAALEYGWTVSFPVWSEQYKDTASAVEHLGPLFVLKSILDARETSALKIELKSKTLYNKL
jgi:DNA primase